MKWNKSKFAGPLWLVCMHVSLSVKEPFNLDDSWFASWDFNWWKGELCMCLWLPCFWNTHVGEVSVTRPGQGGWGNEEVVCPGDGLGHIIEYLHWPEQGRMGSRGDGAEAVKRNSFHPQRQRQHKVLNQEQATSWLCCLMQSEVNPWFPEVSSRSWYPENKGGLTAQSEVLRKHNCFRK